MFNNAFVATILLFMCLMLTPVSVQAEPGQKKNREFTNKDLAVVVNENDSLSIKITDYYQQQRHIPAENIIRVRFAPGKTNMDPDEFKLLKNKIDGITPANVQAFLLTWAAPYRVGCMSISSA